MRVCQKANFGIRKPINERPTRPRSRWLDRVIRQASGSPPLAGSLSAPGRRPTAQRLRPSIPQCKRAVGVGVNAEERSLCANASSAFFRGVTQQFPGCDFDAFLVAC